MIAAYARWISVRARAWAIVALTLLWAAVSGALSLSVEQDDDVLKFLPQSNPDIRAFYEINEAFGSTDVAIVGVRASDVFNADFLGRLRAATSEIKGTPGVDHVLSLTNVADFQKDTVNGGIVSGNLITDLPTDVASSQALREKVMSRDHVVGNLVSAQGDAVVLYAWVGPNESPREVAGRVRAAVERHFPSDDKVWGGGPFISDFIYTATQHDMARLTPWSIITILIIVLLAFRDLLGTVLGLVATGIGITTARALMVIAGVPFNIVLSSMPVILFAAGSAYAIHMLSRYYAHAERLGPGAAAVEAALVGTTRNVVTAGLTTVAGLWSFLLMDIEPMRVFGLFTGIGLIAALLMSLTLVPAVMVLFPRPARASLGKEISARTRELAVLARERRSLSLALMGGVVIVGAVFAGRVDTRMDLSAFFRPDSEPAQSQAFLEERFGGSQFIQIRVQGDLEDPLVLREVARVADRLQVIPHVSGVQGVHEAMEIINDAMSGARRVPDTSGQAGVLYRFLSSDPAVQRLITDARDQALLVVKIDVNDADTIDAVLAAVEGEIERGAMHTIAASPASGDPSRASIAGLVTARLGALAERFGVALPPDAADQVARLLAEPAAQGSEPAVAGAMAALLRSGESFVQLDPAQAGTVGAALAALGVDPAEDARRAAIAGALQQPADAQVVGDLLLIVDAPLRDAWRAEQAKAAADVLLDRLHVQRPAGPAGDRFVALLAAKLQDRDNPTVAVDDGPDAKEVGWTVSGQPVLYRGLSRSVTRNQINSLGGSLLLVWLIMSVVLRSPISGLLATAPTLLTLAVVYGAMGAMGVHLDIGTSMIASIIIGAGVDYAVHLLAAWEVGDAEPIERGAERAIEDAGHAIWTNALMVSAGFFVLTLGDAVPLRNVGGLTAAAMLVAAVATFTVIPVFARRRRYNAEPRLP